MRTQCGAFSCKSASQACGSVAFISRKSRELIGSHGRRASSVPSMQPGTVFASRGTMHGTCLSHISHAERNCIDVNIPICISYLVSRIVSVVTSLFVYGVRRRCIALSSQNNFCLLITSGFFMVLI